MLLFTPLIPIGRFGTWGITLGIVTVARLNQCAGHRHAGAQQLLSPFDLTQFDAEIKGVASQSPIPDFDAVPFQ